MAPVIPGSTGATSSGTSATPPTTTLSDESTASATSSVPAESDSVIVSPSSSVSLADHATPSPAYTSPTADTPAATGTREPSSSAPPSSSSIPSKTSIPLFGSGATSLPAFSDYNPSRTQSGNSGSGTAASSSGSGWVFGSGSQTTGTTSITSGTSSTLDNLISSTGSSSTDSYYGTWGTATTGGVGGSGATASGQAPSATSSGQQAKGKIAGGVVGGVAAAMIVFVLVAWLLRRRKKNLQGLLAPGGDALPAPHTAGTATTEGSFSRSGEMASRRSSNEALFTASYFAPAFMKRVSSEPSERGFQKISGRKIPSPGSPTTSEPSSATFSAGSPVQPRSPTTQPPLATPYGRPLDASYTRETQETGSRTMMFRPSPARTTSANASLHSEHMGPRPVSQVPQIHVSGPVSPTMPKRPDALGRSHPSFDGSRGKPALPPLSPIPSSPRPLRFLIIGAGSRGTAYARAVTTATPGHIHAVAEPHPFKRQLLGRTCIWGEDGTPQDGQEFADWRDWLQWELKRRHNPSNPSQIGVDGVFICTLDSTHVEILHAIAPLKLHILCEKPLALSLADCLSVYRLLTPNLSTNIFSIGHTPAGDGSLLTKSCHDIDFILWLLSSPPPGSTPDTPPHHPHSISSSGALTQFIPARKPPAAGSATNCLSCPAEPDCIYSAPRIYNDMHLARGDTDWPVNIVCEDIEDVVHAFTSHSHSHSHSHSPHSRSPPPSPKSHLLKTLSQDYTPHTPPSTIRSRPWYGRCVYASTNDVCDTQTVTLTWRHNPSLALSHGGPKTATFHMIAPTEKQCERRGRVFGTLGEIGYDSRTISVCDFRTRQTKTIEVPKRPPEEEKAHGGGDYGLARGFVGAVDAVINGGCGVREAQRRFVGCGLEEVVRSHAVGFAAEVSRREERVVRWGEWWGERLREAGVEEGVD
ncbi:hypothetical protein BO71DRAFT_420687 [Aspergillus ellipticus CBS 707.79]|uniref:Gfo/Idh/MocA-like oxidoreductase N-terminal domain-containing protein n=1 Tax=Aspergillus ellipticus CBS 707.79 TaxID=1448320 RepID=A0A319D5C8_9EURO|nr:hypothetical protein BO71DRAFT_420687 [Aspergillus ellipticus CBS 707.79]